MRNAESTWLSCLRRYLSFLALGNLAWEALHMPLYTLWYEGSYQEIILFGLHCVGGDLLIGASSLLIALLVFANPSWPRAGYGRSAALTVLFGAGYTLWSEWYNVNVQAAWAYSTLMPLIPVVNVGLSPLAQWIVIPTVSFWWAKRQ